MTGVYYHWAVRSAGYDFKWGQDLNGYYDHLARGFAEGHLYLPIEPSPELLAQPNPWSPGVDDSLKLFDAVLFNRHYYLYHGAGPAVMLFLPYRLITHHDLPENYALYLFCFGGYLLSAAALMTLVKPGPVVLTLLLLALGLCQSVPFLLSRVWVYELAAGAGYFCLAAAFFFFVRNWPIPAGLMFGLAVACRPHFIIPGLIALALICCNSRRRALAFAIPFVLTGIGIATYNYERFGNPVEFGNSYMLTGANMGKLKLSGANLPPGLYYMLLAPPDFTPVFPWVRMKWPPPSVPRPAGYVVEPTIGALWLAPVAAGVLLIFFVRTHRVSLWLLLSSAAGILLFITMTGWSTQRYEVDFLPSTIMVALTCVALVIPRYAAPVLAPLIAFGIVVNLAIGISGPIDEMVKNRPARYVKIASWFSPIAKYRPQLNPLFHVELQSPIGPVRQDLMAAGRQYELYAEPLAGKPTLISHSSQSTVTHELEATGKPIDFHVTYVPQSGEIHVAANGQELIAHKIGSLVAAPAEIVVTARRRPGS